MPGGGERWGDSHALRNVAAHEGDAAVRSQNLDQQPVLLAGALGGLARHAASRELGVEGGKVCQRRIVKAEKKLGSAVN